VTGHGQLLECRLPESSIPPAHVVEMRTLGPAVLRADGLAAGLAAAHPRPAVLPGLAAIRAPLSRAARDTLARAELSAVGRQYVDTALRRIGELSTEIDRCGHNWPVSPSTRRGVGRCDSCIRNPIGPPIPCRPCGSCGLLIHYG
jgi:hypothetical protein